MKNAQVVKYVHIPIPIVTQFSTVFSSSNFTAGRIPIGFFPDFRPGTNYKWQLEMVKNDQRYLDKI